MTERCILYVDGYNFYYAVKKHPATTPIHLGWCDFQELARQFMLPPGGELEKIKYFTAPVGKHGSIDQMELGSEAKRQQRWLDALKSIAILEPVEGYYTGDTDSPRGREEKETDVNIAISLVIDAALDEFDRALLMTGDRDQRPAVKAVSERFGKRVDVWVSPNQEVGFWKAAEAYRDNLVRVRSITPAMLRKSRLPERLTVNGTIVEAPKMWRQR